MFTKKSGQMKLTRIKNQAIDMKLKITKILTYYKFIYMLFKSQSNSCSCCECQRIYINLCGKTVQGNEH